MKDAGLWSNTDCRASFQLYNHNSAWEDGCQFIGSYPTVLFCSFFHFVCMVPERVRRITRMCTPSMRWRTARVLTDIFKLSLSESVTPTCFKQITIVPVPKNTKVTCLNDYRPVALTSVAMKCFERLVMAHINTIIPETLEPLNLHTAPTDPISIAFHTAKGTHMW